MRQRVAEDIRPLAMRSWVVPDAQFNLQARTHQVDEIVAMEALHGSRRRGHQRVIEAFERIATAFDVWVIGGEEAHASPVFPMIQPTSSCG